jgi:hypothetical protein
VARPDNLLIFLTAAKWHSHCYSFAVMARSTVTLILPQAQGIASTRPTLAGMLVRRRGGSRVMFAPIDARLARAQLTAIQAVKVSR